MVIAFVQSKSTQIAGTSSVNLSFDSPVTAGNCVVVFTTSWFYQSSGVTDNQSGNTYNSLVAIDAGAGNPHARVFGTLNVAASGTFTATVSFPGNADATIIIAEFSGVATSGAAEVANTAAGTGTAVSVSTSGATTDAGDALVGIVTHDGSTMAITETYSLIAEQENNSSSQSGNAQYRLPGSIDTHALAWTMASSTGWIAAVVALKPAAGTSPARSMLALLGAG